MIISESVMVMISQITVSLLFDRNNASLIIISNGNNPLVDYPAILITCNNPRLPLQLVMILINLTALDSVIRPSQQLISILQLSKHQSDSWAILTTDHYPAIVQWSEPAAKYHQGKHEHHLSTC